MKHLILLTIILLTGCTTKNSNTKSAPHKQEVYGWQIQEIDNCEYIIFYGDIRSLTHKGNCKFCQKRNEVFNLKNNLK